MLVLISGLRVAIVITCYPIQYHKLQHMDAIQCSVNGAHVLYFHVI